MDAKIVKINDTMIALEKVARTQIKTDEDKLLVASALMAVTRNLYVEAVGPADTAHIFASVVDSFSLMEVLISQYKPTYH